MYISLSASLLIPAELKYCSSCNRHEWKFLFWPSHLGGCIPVVRIDALSLGVTSLSVMRLNASSVLARTSALASAGCVSCVHPVCSLSTSISLAVTSSKLLSTSTKRAVGRETPSSSSSLAMSFSSKTVSICTLMLSSS